MTRIAISGTPGTGKTAVADELRNRGYNVIDVSKHIKEHNLVEEWDVTRETYNVDVKKLSESLSFNLDADKIEFFESHLSHFIDCDFVIILRCDPGILHDRLSKRKYSASKIRENIQAEILDVILCEAEELTNSIFELDTSTISIKSIVDSIEHIINGKGNDYKPGKIDWTEEMDKWF